MAATQDNPSDLPADILEFVERAVLSFLAWDLVILFARRGPQPVALEEVCRLTGRQETEVETELDRLVGIGLLRADKNVLGKVYQRVEGAGGEALRMFADFNAQQENRLRILSHLLHKGVR